MIAGLTSHDLSPSLGVKVEARIARASYGVIFDEDWDPDRHLPKTSKVWSEYWQKWTARDQMRWFLKQVCWRMVLPMA